MGQVHCYRAANNCLQKKETSNYEYCPAPIIRVKSARRIGYGATKTNLQDTILINEGWADDCHLFGIFDGFGPHGHSVSELAAKAMRAKIEESKKEIFSVKFQRDLEQILKGIVKDVETRLKESDIDCSTSGTCVLCFIIIKNQGYIINLGNSRAILLSEAPQTTGPSQLTKDHNADDENEAKRITKNNGKIKKLALPSGESIGMNRVWIDDTKLGFTATRALGGFDYKRVLSSEPDIIKVDFSPFDKLMTIASDGVWDVMKNEEIVEFIQTAEPDSEDNVAESLIKEATKRWEKLNKRPKEFHLGVGDDPANHNGADDLAVIVIFFQFPAKISARDHVE